MIARFLREAVRNKGRLIGADVSHVLHQVHEGVAFDIKFPAGPGLK